jgi:hypothetical protein
MRCVEWYDKFEKDGNFCGLSASGVSQVKAYNEMRAKIATHIPDKAFVVDNFTENAARAVTKYAKDDETRTKAINWVVTRLKRKEKVDYGTLQKTISAWQKPQECTVDNKGGNLGHVDENFTYVKSPTDGKPEKPLPTSPYQPAPGSIVVTGAPPISPIDTVLKERYTITETLPALSPDADMKERLKRDEILLKMALAEPHPFSTAAELINGGMVTKPAPYKIVPEHLSEKDADDLILQVVTRRFTPKSRELWDAILSSGEMGDTPARLFENLVCQVGGGV